MDEIKSKISLNRPKLLTVEFHEDDPVKCTSAKMSKFRLARSIRINQIPPHSIVLNPFAPDVLLKSDNISVQHGGLVVIDCSWANATPHFKRRLSGIQRRLPALMAGNPTNYSRVGALSSLEASAAALSILGLHDYSKKLLSLYKWGETFLSLNENALKDYEAAQSQDEVRALELDYFPQLSKQNLTKS